MKIAVGCPIRNRAWIFEEWVEHVRIAFDLAGVKPFWVFAIGVGPSGKDDGTRQIVTDLYRNEPGIWTEIAEPIIPNEDQFNCQHEQWNGGRYEQMAEYRNRLLGLAQAISPDYFLSLDSDILLHPSALLCMLDTIQHKHRIKGTDVLFDAVGGKAFLSEGSEHITTYGTLAYNGGIRRVNSDAVFPTQILMAIKLMSPAAYHIPYEANQFGEDIGWSLNCEKAGLNLGWDGRVCSKHIMNREQLSKVDRRVGW